MEPLYVALGDSMSIDAYAGGPGRGAASLLHRNSDGERILDTLRAMAGHRAAIVVSTVYDPSDGTGRLPDAALPPWPDGARLLADFNAALTEAAHRHGALVADVYTHFRGHGAAVGNPAQPDPRPANTDLWYCGVIEPNGYGAHQIRRVWWNTLESISGKIRADS